MHSDESNCSFCDRPVENPSGWPVCERCWYSGRYLEWLMEELTHVELGSDRHRELAVTFNKVAGLPWAGTDKTDRLLVIGKWKAAAVAQARGCDRERIKALVDSK